MERDTQLRIDFATHARKKKRMVRKKIFLLIGTTYLSGPAGNARESNERERAEAEGARSFGRRREMGC